MQKQTLSIIILIFILSVFINSCKEKNIEKTNKSIKSNQIGKTWKPIKFKINFPDTVLVNKLYDGEITYNSILDTIITSFGDPEKNRYTRFISSTTDNVDYDFEYLKQKIVQDTFGAIDNRTIPFYDIRFNKTGVYYIDGIINDIVLIDLHQKDKEGYGLSRFIENEERVTHKVYVIDSTGTNR